jgi:hypothetical protein
MPNVARIISLCAVAIALTVAIASAAPNVSVVVVYPLTVSGTADPGVGAQIASLMGQELKAAGGVEIREPSPSVARQDYLESARKLGADYYVTGFVTKVSGQLSVVEQLVSTLTNTTVWSNSALLVSTDDARAQGDLVRGIVLGHSGRALISLNPGPVASAAAKAAPVSAAAAPATATAASGAVSAAVPASATSASVRPTYAVLLTGGSASERNRAYADGAVVKALRARGYVADLLNDPVGDLAILGPAICASTGVKVLLGGKVAIEIQSDREINQWATATIDMARYDCVAGRSLSVLSADAATYNWNWAVDQAVAAVLKNV